MWTPHSIESAVFVLLLAVSLYGFWRRFGAVVNIVRAARSDAAFELQPIGSRVRKFVWEVLLQGLVIRERPLTGIAHAFVFWGFLAFALVTLDHFAAGLGFHLIPRDGWFGPLYFGFVAIFAIAVLVSITGLTMRRYLMRPKWLGKVSLESGVIAFLIAVLMTTYLVGYGFGEEGTFGHVNWWVHTAALLLFLPLIPKTKHLHLILSPATVFLERHGFARIPPLQGDEDYGLVNGKDVTSIDALQAFTCVECGRCTEHCPAYNTGKELNPKTVILGMREYLNEHGPKAEEPLLGPHISQTAVFQCTTCGACEYQCPVGIQHLPVMIGLRRGAVNTGKWEDDHGNKLFLALERNGNALGIASSERDKFIQKNELPLLDGTQEYCLWLGCMGSYDPKGREIIVALAQVMRHLGVTFGVLRKERCTGDPARRLGNDLAFGQLVEQNTEQIKASKATKFLSICPHCVRTMEEDWKEFGASVAIEHHSEFLARHRERLPSGTMDGKVVFHDPCYLGRYRGIYEEPRQVIKRSAEILEPPRTRERSFCCGAGGGLAFLGEEQGKRVSVERAEQLISTGASVVGAACPFCNTMFRDALAGLSLSPPALLDIAQIAAASLPKTLPSDQPST